MDNMYVYAKQMVDSHNDLQDTIHNMWSTANFNMALGGVITWKEYWDREDKLMEQKKYIGISDIIKYV